MLKAMVTVPADALSEVLSNFSCPLGSAAIASEPLLDPLEGVDALVGVELDELLGALALEELDELLAEDDEPPHPARAGERRTSAHRKAERRVMSRWPPMEWASTTMTPGRHGSFRKPGSYDECPIEFRRCALNAGGQST